MNPTSANDTIVQEIVIKAPAELIFEALTDPVHRIKWRGGEGRFQTTTWSLTSLPSLITDRTYTLPRPKVDDAW